MLKKISRVSYFVMKAIKDIKSPLIYEICHENKSNSLKEYYFLFDYKQLLKGGSYEFDFDNRGIPIIKGHFTDTNGEYFYNPQAIGQFGLALYHDYLETNERSNLDKFLSISDWFVDNYKEYKNIVYWQSNEVRTKNVYGLDEIQKLSSMSQSRAISILLRAYQETSNNKYIELAERAIVAYKTSIEDGGFLKRDKNLHYFEEPGQPGIFNHMIFTIFGLLDYCRFHNYSTEYKKLLSESIDTIKKIIPVYDSGWWSYYDNYYIDGVRRINPCTRHYHNIHIKQLMVLYNITNDSLFEDYYQKWIKYDRKTINRMRMLTAKFSTVRKMKRL